MRPQVRTKMIGSQRQVVIQADTQAALDSVLLGSRELQIELPLDVLVEQNTAPVFLRKFTRGRGFRVLVMLRPALPVVDLGALLLDGLVECRWIAKRWGSEFALALDYIASARRCAASYRATV